MCGTKKLNSHTEVCQKDPGLAYKNVIVNVVFILIDTLLNKLQQVAEVAYTPSIPEID